MARHRRFGRKEIRRMESKRERAAARQALRGGHSRLIPSDRWRHRPQQPVVSDE